jgi:predicted GH43/DUF377 family glycosyl hydrolase
MTNPAQVHHGPVILQPGESPTANPVQVHRDSIILRPDQTRVLLRPFVPGGARRIASILGRVMALSEECVAELLNRISVEFSKRHQNTCQLFLERFEQVRSLLVTNAAISEPRQHLIGAYFLAEYSLESAALFNPSIVPHPDQTDLPAGALRFVLSLRATGEGHISSITFLTGIVHADHRIEVLPTNRFLTEPRQVPNPGYQKKLFSEKLTETGLTREFTRRVMTKLGDSFSLEDLRAGLKAEEFLLPDGMTQADPMNQEDREEAKGIWMVARSNYEVQFQPDQQLSERVLFPSTASQSNGIEDARFVHFRNDDGSYVYYATFTAYDGRAIMSQLVETSDFLRFCFSTLNGPAVENKGMALFPRKIKGLYAMLSRQDGENISLMYSDNVHFWHTRTVLLKPKYPWELVQVGNCGSPIETDAGWLVLSHGVGPMRKYCIGAFLLDKDDPGKVLGRLKDPLIKPNETEREGYVPNVVYTCGYMLWDGELIIPYGLADHATGFATVRLDELLAAMTPADDPA